MESSRLDAQKALSAIGKIDHSVKEAENQTATSQKALGDAADNAKSAALIATDAQKVAESASMVIQLHVGYLFRFYDIKFYDYQEATKVRSETSRALNSATGLATEVESFKESIGGPRGISQTLNNYKDMVVDDKRSTQDVRVGGIACC